LKANTAQSKGVNKLDFRVSQKSREHLASAPQFFIVYQEYALNSFKIPGYRPAFYLIAVYSRSAYLFSLLTGFRLAPRLYNTNAFLPHGWLGFRWDMYTLVQQVYGVPHRLLLESIVR
jgi:hypothetical protein